jgi:hypothetical protein
VLIAAGTGVAVSAVSTVVPALSLRRLPTAALLAPE